MYEIDKNVDYYKTRNGRKEYPFEKMEVNDSFHVSIDPDKMDLRDANKLRNSVTNSVSWMNRSGKVKFGDEGKFFSVRTVYSDDPRGPGIRVFRIR